MEKADFFMFTHVLHNYSTLLNGVLGMEVVALVDAFLFKSK